MAHIVLFHHAQGLTVGLLETIEQLRAAGHSVTAPDMFEGRTFPTVDQGVAYVENLSFDTVFARAEAALSNSEPLDPDVPHVYIGYSMGAVPATQHALDDPDADALILMHAAVDPAWFEHEWNPKLRVQVHSSQDDQWMEFDALDALREAHAAPVETYLFPGSAHLYSDSSVPEYIAADAAASYAEIFRLLNEME